MEQTLIQEAARRNIKNTHPEYERMLPQWAFFLDAYEGGFAFTSKPAYLFSHARETAEDRAFRLKRVVYYNYCRSIIDIYVSYIYRREVVRESNHPLFETFLNDIDLRGNDINTFMASRVAPMAQVLGVVFVVVDMPPAPEGLKTAYEERALGIRPYARLLLPFNLVDWELDSDGQFLWAKVREVAPSERGPLDDTQQTKWQYRIWTRNRWFLLDEDGNFLNPNGPKGEPHPLGRVPIARVYNERSFLNTLAGVSALQDIAPICQRIYNLCSLLDEFLYKQCFSFLAWPGDVDVERLTTANIASLDPETRLLPTYITPPTDPARFIESQIEKSIEEIYRLARIRYAVMETHAESGIARAIEFHDTNNILAKKARNLEAGEREIFELLFAWMGEEPDFRVVYPKEFSVRAANEEIEEAVRVMGLELSRTLNARLAKRLVRRILPSLSTDEGRRIEDEIDVHFGLKSNAS